MHPLAYCLVGLFKIKTLDFQKVAVNEENVNLDVDQKVCGGIHGGQSPGFW